MYYIGWFCWVIAVLHHFQQYFSYIYDAYGYETRGSQEPVIAHLDISHRVAMLNYVPH
jgi:hypothetical protein